MAESYKAGDRVQFLRFGRLFKGTVEAVVPASGEYVVVPDGKDEILVHPASITGRVK